MLGWFQALMPKEDRFFDLFNRHAEVVVAGGEALVSLLEGGEGVPLYSRIIKERENEADEITREVLLAVRRSFITPFDRGAIKDLINAMDDAIDQMHHTAKTIALYELSEFEPQMREMAALIVQAARLNADAMPLLSKLSPNAGRLASITEEVTRIEGRADDIHEEGLKRLFRTHGRTDTMAYIIGTELYDRLEGVMDRLEDVANEVSAIVIEHV